MTTDTTLAGPAPDRGGPAQPLLVVDSLKKYFPGRAGPFARARKFVHAVDGVSFAVAKARRWALSANRAAANRPRRAWWHA
jgi:peptide/nickel transport system ATP-binding protein